MSENMVNSKTVLMLAILPVLAVGCSSAPGSAPASRPTLAATEPSHEPSFLQVDEEHLVQLKDVRAASFVRNESSDGASYDIVLEPGLTLVYTDQVAAYAAWKRVAGALGGTLHDDKWLANLPVSPKTKSTQPSFFSPPATDGYTHLTEQLSWLMKCVDAKLLSDAEYQQGRAWAIAELQSNPGGGQGTAQPQFEELYQRLVGLAKSKDSGLLSDDEAAKVRASIVKQAGLVE